jgi:hypothetical protein
MAQGVSALLASLKRSSKKDEVPGTVISVLEENCPICSRKMKLYRPCCGSPLGYKGCNCGYKVVLTNDSV